MTEPQDPGAGLKPQSGGTTLTSAGPGPGSTSHAELEAYVTANAGRYTDEALYDTLVAAGYPANDVRAALAGAASRLRPQRTAPRAVRTIVGAYVAVFAILSAGMLLNGRAAGYLMPDVEGGIRILAVSLGVAFVASLIWVASRRLFVILILVLVAVYGLAAMAPGNDSTLVGLAAVVLGIGGVVLLLRRQGDAGSPGQTELAVLLALPILLLLGIAGICVASGLPIPGMA